MEVVMYQFNAKKWLTALVSLLFLYSTHAFADVDADENLFKCVHQTKLEVDFSCINDKIEVSVNYQAFQRNFNSQIDDLGGNVMSTIIFYPEFMETHVVAHFDKLSGFETASLHSPHKKDGQQ